MIVRMINNTYFIRCRDSQHNDTQYTCQYISCWVTFFTFILSAIEQHALKNVNNCLNTNIYSYLETSGDQSSNLYLNVVHLFNTSVKVDICGSLRQLFSWIMGCSVLLSAIMVSDMLSITKQSDVTLSVTMLKTVMQSYILYHYLECCFTESHGVIRPFKFFLRFFFFWARFKICQIWNLF